LQIRQCCHLCFFFFNIFVATATLWRPHHDVADFRVFRKARPPETLCCAKLESEWFVVVGILILPPNYRGVSQRVLQCTDPWRAEPVQPWNAWGKGLLQCWHARPPRRAAVWLPGAVWPADARPGIILCSRLSCSCSVLASAHHANFGYEIVWAWYLGNCTFGGADQML
jgi:hypothetical protein